MFIDIAKLYCSENFFPQLRNMHASLVRLCWYAVHQAFALKIVDTSRSIEHLLQRK